MVTLDRLIVGFDRALRTVAAPASAGRPSPADAVLDADSAASGPGTVPLTADERRESGALMRVNHVGEVCAQALYQAQALTARSEEIRQRMQQAAREETDHLAWTEERLRELGAHRSVLNPLWYAGAFGIGLAAGRAGDRVSLGFVIETERQVEAHLAGHLERLPRGDERSRAIVRQMQLDEARHADAAQDCGGVQLPLPLRALMRAAAKVMTFTAHRI